MLRFALPIAALAAVLALLNPASAAGSSAQPAIKSHDVPTAETYVQTLSNKVSDVLASKIPEAEKESKVKSIIDTELDGPAIAKYTLRARWRSATSTEFDEFVKLLTQYASTFYEGRLNDFSGAHLTVTGSLAHQNAAVVGTMIDHLKDQDPINVNWLVIANAGSFKLLDFQFEGIWIARSWGDQFASIIDQNGGKFAALNDHLRKQLAGGYGASTASAKNGKK